MYDDEIFEFKFSPVKFSSLWLTSHPRSTAVPLDTGTPGTSREIYSENEKSTTVEK